jgi:hypothetical protein
MSAFLKNQEDSKIYKEAFTVYDRGLLLF